MCGVQHGLCAYGRYMVSNTKVDCLTVRLSVKYLGLPRKLRSEDKVQIGEGVIVVDKNHGQGKLWEELVLTISKKSSAVLVMNFFVL